MARAFAINGVATAMVAALNASSTWRALCPGGAYRAPQPAQQPPYAVVGPCSERPSDTFGAANLGSMVTIPITVPWADGDDLGEDRSVGILESAVALFEASPVTLSVSAWSVLHVRFVQVRSSQLELIDGSVLPATTADLEITVRMS